MAVLDRFFIRVDDNNIYSANGTFKTLRQLHTADTKLYPENPLDMYVHPVVEEMGENPNAFRQIYSTDPTKFVNESEGIDFLFDTLSDAMTPMVSGRLFKAGVDYPIMHPYMVAVLDNFSQNRNTEPLLLSGTYTLGRFGSVGSVKNAGIIEIQGGGGGSGGTNNTNSDSAGGGGGSGGFAAIYYRVKNTTSQVTMTVKVGAGGSAGSGASGSGGTGGPSSVEFVTPGGYCKITAEGGQGGKTLNEDYTPGGAGGDVIFEKKLSQDSEMITNTLSAGGVGGTSSRNPKSATLINAETLQTNNNFYEDEYLVVSILVAKGGSGGGRGDDTDGTTQGQAGAGSSAFSFNIPFCCGNLETSLSFDAFSGGKRGASVSDASAGGGGASVYANGGAGGKESTNGNPGDKGSGAGGAGCGGNKDRRGSVGGDGLVKYRI